MVIATSGEDSWLSRGLKVASIAVVGALALLGVSGSRCGTSAPSPSHSVSKTLLACTVGRPRLTTHVRRVPVARLVTVCDDDGHLADLQSYQTMCVSCVHLDGHKAVVTLRSSIAAMFDGVPPASCCESPVQVFSPATGRLVAEHGCDTLHST